MFLLTKFNNDYNQGKDLHNQYSIGDAKEINDESIVH